MVRKKEDFNITVVQAPKGGVGVLNRISLLDDVDLGKSVKKVAYIELEPNSRMGVHKHDGDCEAYFFTSGSGIYVDDDKQVSVKAGDYTMVHDGHSHGVINNSNSNLCFLALILDECKQ